MLLDTYPKEYNEFEARVVVHNFCDFFLYANERMVFRIILAYILFIMSYSNFYVFAAF